MMWHGNLDAIVAPHQDTILGSPQMGNAHGQPYADRQQGDGKCEGGHVCQHPLPIIVCFLRDALVRHAPGRRRPERTQGA